MGRIKISGIEELENMLSALGDKSGDIASKALYEGAGHAASEVKAAIGSIPEDKMRFLRNGDKLASVTATTKADLMGGVGIATFEHSGSKVTTAVGIEGYSSISTPKYPGGFPLPALARWINSGTSYRAKFPFMRSAKGSIKGSAAQVMVKTAEAEINKIIK